LGLQISLGLQQQLIVLIVSLPLGLHPSPLRPSSFSTWAFSLYLASFMILIIDVPSTCTTKDAPSNVLRQSSQVVKPLNLCEWGYKRILRRLVLWNLLYMGKGKIKRILILCLIEFFDKGEGRHKRIQAVSPLFFWKREKRGTKRIQAVSPWRILFGKGRREWKDE